ncbi:MAG TPA: caspase family protein, partial [Polyangiaceae bacterium]|nr:caspase family protein [Polyangiaceae bacterium]
LRRVRGANSAFGLSLSENGRVLAVYAPEGDGKTGLSIQIHDLDKSEPPRSIKFGNFLFALTPDGKKLAIATAGVDLYDAKSGARLAEARFPTTQALTMDREGKRIAAAASGEILVMELPSLRIVHRFTNPHYQGIQSTADDLVLAGKTLWLRTVVGEVHLFDAATGAARAKLPGTHTNMTLGKNRVWTLSENEARAWDPQTGAPRGKGGRTSMHAKKIAASADGSTLAVASSDPVAGNEIAIRDAATALTQRTLRGETTALATVAIDPKGAQVATASQLGVVMRWNAQTGKLVGRGDMQRAAVAALSYDSTGALLGAASGGPFARVYDAETGAIAHQWNAHQGGTSFAAFLPRSKTLLTAGWDGIVKRWEVSGQKSAQAQPAHAYASVAPPQEQKVGEAPFAIKSGALSESGKLVALVGTQGKRLGPGQWYAPSGGLPVLDVALLEVATGKLRWRATLPSVWRETSYIAVSPDDQSVVVTFEEKTGPNSFEAKLRSYDAASGKVRDTRALRYNAPIAFLGKTLAIGGKRPTIESWPGPSTPIDVSLFDVDVTAVTADPKRGRYVFVGSAGGTSFVSTNGKVIATMVATSDGEFLTSTPDGAFVASLDGRRAAGWAFVKPLEGFSFAQFAQSYERPDVVAERLAGRNATELAPVSRPPAVELHELPKRVAGDLELRGKVSSIRRVERVRVFVNARPVADELVCAKDGELKLEVPLEAGRNRVTAVAYDADGHASAPASHDVTSTKRDAAPVLWTVAVGVSNYPKLAPEHQLEYADDDARSVVSALRPFSDKGGPFAKLRATTLIDNQVDPKSVERALAGLAKMNPQDLAVVFLAGHGLRLKDGRMVFLTSTADLTDKGARAGGIGWDRIEAVLRAARGRVILLLDACHSGHMSTELIAENEELAARLASDNRSGVLIFAAARGSQFSYEVPPPGNRKVASRGLELAWDGAPPRIAQAPTSGHGLFTSALLEAWGGKAVDRDRSGGIELGEFVDYVTERVREASNGKQTPWVVRRELFGDFFVAPAKR